MARHHTSQTAQFGLLMAIAAASLGCSGGPEMAAVHGTVSLDGKPLAFGVVMLHPAKGQVAQAAVTPDGQFDVSTFVPGDGVPLGHYDVSVLCFEGHDPRRQDSRSDGTEGFLLGKSLIPLRYTRANSSGLTVDVGSEGVDNLVLDLHSYGK